MQARAPDMAIISAEKLVAGIPRKRDRDAAPRQRRDQMGRDLRRIAEGLVVHLRELWNHIARIGRRDDQLGMIGGEMIGDASRVESLH